MLARKFRLTKEKDITKTFKGKSARGSFFVIRAVPNRFGNVRIAIIVGKKVSLKSTERNLVKRRASEAIKDTLFSLSPFDISINAFSQAVKASFGELQNDLNALFEKIGVKK